jgi:hypothetical protein
MRRCEVGDPKRVDFQLLCKWRQRQRSNQCTCANIAARSVKES